MFVRTKIQFFESKSQLVLLLVRVPQVVRQNKDTIFWKQITTSYHIYIILLLLFVRTKIQFFESKSQPNPRLWYANFVVRQNKDTIFWKQITTRVDKRNNAIALFVRTKIQFFESKSQPIVVCIAPATCCSSEQRYNFLKANHNCRRQKKARRNVVRQNKDTIFWKQITTGERTLSAEEQLFVRTKIQFFESKSQLVLIVNQLTKVVRQNKDTIFWKQITTRLGYR